jgi:putative peptidoglycan lipid II flippase
LQQYGWGVPAFVLAPLISRAFFARQDTRTPMNFAVVSVAVNVIFGFLFFHLFGVAGIAAATSLASWTNVAMMLFTLARRDAYRLSAAAMARLTRILLASGILCVMLSGASYARPAIETLFSWVHLGHSVGAKEFAILFVTLLAGLFYPAILLTVGGVTPAEVRGALRRGR